MDHSWPSSSGILQARILERVAILFFRGFFQPGDQTWVSCIAGRFFTIWATKEALYEEGVNISRNWATRHFWSLMVGLRSVTELVSISLVYVLQWASTEVQGLVEVELSAVLGLLDSNQVVCVLGLCHSFKIYALPPAPVFQVYFWLCWIWSFWRTVFVG